MSRFPTAVRPAPHAGQRGVGLVEIMVATVIAVVAIIALAYTFGTGRGLVDRYAAARLGLAAAQRRLEILATLPPSAPELQFGPHGPQDVLLGGQVGARESWQVSGWDDPATSASPDLKQVIVSIQWSGSTGDTLTLQRLFPLD